MDVPILETVLVGRDDGPGPFNSGAIAESANVPTAAAVANAVSDAIGKPVLQLPVTAEYVPRAVARQLSRGGPATQ